MSQTPGFGPEELQTALSSVAQAIAESLELKEVWERVAEACRTVVPFDVMGVSQFLPGERVRVVVAAGDPSAREFQEGAVFGRNEFSSVFWPDEEDFLIVIHDAERELIPSFRVDRELLELGYRSALRLPLGRGTQKFGSLILVSRTAHRFTREHGERLGVVAEMVTLALAHEKLARQAAEESRRAAEAQARAGQLEERVQKLVEELETLSPHRALGRSRKWRDVLAEATKVAATDTTVLITGESGTGKEVIARFLHRGSKRAKRPFTALNCAALPEQLLESELFGHERGAFTGALEARPGKIEQAASGVLFLDEVGEMSPAVQAKFLRVLQEREFQRVGGTRTLKADVRVIAATNRDPRVAIAAGTFREDLYYRLGVFEIHLPPLRERPEDILVLAEAFLEEVGRTVGRPAAGLSEDAREQLLVHHWPGNVRELRNAIERAVILCQGGLVTREHLPISLARPPEERVAVAVPQSADFPVEGVALNSVERELLLKAMAKAGNNKSQAAKLLGLSRGQLYSLLRRHGLTNARR